MFNLGEFSTPLNANYATDVEIVAVSDIPTTPFLLEWKKRAGAFPPVAPEVDFDAKRFAGAWTEFRARATANGRWWKPTLNGRFDEFRWKLHRKLLDWKVII